jgi:cytochrome P450
VLSRKARVATELGPYKIAAQTNVVIPIYVMQRSEKHWPNALEFRPERFFDDEAEKSYAFLPFSKGPRRCIGELFAMAEISCVLVQFYKRYKVATITELPQDIAHVSLKPLGGLWVQLRER